MNGRMENDKRLEDEINWLMFGCPEIVIRYSYNFVNKTQSTKLKYIKYVIEFICYLEDKGYDTDDNSSFRNIKTSDINIYMEHIRFDKNSKEVSSSYRATKLYAISHFFEFLIDEEICDKNPCKRASVPKDRNEKEVVFMTPEEIQHVKQNIINGCGNDISKQRQEKWKNRDLAIFMLGCTTGLRVTSISEINIQDIDFENKTLKVIEKGNKQRTCMLSDSVIDCILKWIDDREKLLGKPLSMDMEALFISRERNRIGSPTIRALIKKYTYDIDKKITPHKMRSSCATNLYEITGDIYLVQQVLGHKNIQNTKRYASVSKRKLEDAASALDKLYNEK